MQSARCEFPTGNALKKIGKEPESCQWLYSKLVFQVCLALNIFSYTMYFSLGDSWLFFFFFEQVLLRFWWQWWHFLSMSTCMLHWVGLLHQFNPMLLSGSQFKSVYTNIFNVIWSYNPSNIISDIEYFDFKLLCGYQSDLTCIERTHERSSKKKKKILIFFFLIFFFFFLPVLLSKSLVLTEITRELGWVLFGVAALLSISRFVSVYPQ